MPSTDPSWFTGPEFLQQPEEKWTFTEPPEVDEEDERLELRKQVEPDLIQSFRFNGSLYRIQKTFAYVSRFIKIQKGEARTFNVQPFTAQDLHDGLLLAVRVVQCQYFQTEYRMVQDGKLLPASSRLLKLAPFIDDTVRKIQTSHKGN